MLCRDTIMSSMWWKPISCSPALDLKLAVFAAAHAIHHGLCELDDVHHYLHGEGGDRGRVLAGLSVPADEARVSGRSAFKR